MPIVAEHYQFVIGVDTHAASHAFAVIGADNGAVESQGQFSGTDAGLSRAVNWAARLTARPGSVVVVVESIGAYGAGVALAFTALVRTEALGIDARTALTLRQLRQVAAWRARSDEAIDVARVDATRLARRVLVLRDGLRVNECPLRDLAQKTASSLLAMPGVGPVNRGRRHRRVVASRPGSRPWPELAPFPPRQARPAGTDSTAVLTGD